MRFLVSFAALGLAVSLAACETTPNPTPTCTRNIQEQNDAFGALVDKRFGKSPLGYDIRMKAPRVKDERGNLILEGIKIYALTKPYLGEPRDAYKLTAVLHPCTLTVLKSSEPRGWNARVKKAGGRIERDDVELETPPDNGSTSKS
ncbi:hypothetical protein [Phenylobacterium sp.]|uniref:hypothetical protein n=1 Tax=Phenylobacterium sp. TaxID=1871053 RepID=UPI002FC6B465